MRKQLSSDRRDQLPLKPNLHSATVGTQPSRARRDLADLLTLLIESFEEHHYELHKASPLEALRFPMGQHHLRQKDLLDVFTTPSVASEVLSGRRELSREHIRRLSARFSVPIDLFF